MDSLRGMFFAGFSGAFGALLGAVAQFGFGIGA